MKMIDGNKGTFLAGEALEADRRVKLDGTTADTVVYSDAGEDWIGVTTEKVAINEHVTVDMRNKSGSFNIEATGAFALGATVYGTADGKVDDVAVGVPVGTANTAASGAGSIVEIMPSSVTYEKTVQIALSRFKKTDLVTPLGAAGDATVLGLDAGTHGTNGPSLKASDAGGTSASEVARMLLEVPADYAGGDLTLRFHAGILTTVSDDTSTLDVEVYETDEEAGVGSDLQETALQSLNSLTFADLDYVVDGDGLLPGDALDVELTVATTDAGNAGAMIPCIGAMKLIYTGLRGS